MEMKPRRKRGRPRKYPLPQDSAATKPAAVTNDAATLALEEENKMLKKQLEAVEEQEKGLTSKQLQKRVILSDDEKTKLHKRIKEDEDMLSGQVKNLSNETWGTLVARNDLIQDREAVKLDLLKAKRQLAMGEVPNLTSKDMAKLKERKDKLDAYLKERKANIGDQWDARDRYRMNETVQNIVKFEEECGDIARELKTINKILDPNNPNASNLGYLEPPKKKE